MRVFRVGTFYPYAIVAAESPEQALELAKGSTNTGLATAEGVQLDKIEELDTSEPTILDLNEG